MNRILLAFFILVLFFASTSVAGEVTQKSNLKVWSPAFESNGTISKKYGCAGENVSPALMIESVPPGTKSMALIFDDLDAPGGSYVHWILWNIDPRTNEIRENSFPEGAVQGMNDFKKQSYGGPCPPTRPHRYVFKVFVLDTLLALAPGSTKPDLEKAMKGHILGQAQLKGTYSKK